MRFEPLSCFYVWWLIDPSLPPPTHTPHTHTHSDRHPTHISDTQGIFGSQPGWISGSNKSWCLHVSGKTDLTWQQHRALWRQGIQHKALHSLGRWWFLYTQLDCAASRRCTIGYFVFTHSVVCGYAYYTWLSCYAPNIGICQRMVLPCNMTVGSFLMKYCMTDQM